MFLKPQHDILTLMMSMMMMIDDDNGGSVNDDDIGAQGGAFEWEFGFALKNFVPPICPADVGFLFWRLKNILHTPPTHSSH